MLTSRRGGEFSRSWPAALAGIAFALSSASFTPAHAAEVTDWSCVGGYKGFNCVDETGPRRDPNIRIVPQPVAEADKSRAEERDRKWLARCHPTVGHDRYGVARYRYAAAGCEFGIGED